MFDLKIRVSPAQCRYELYKCNNPCQIFIAHTVGMGKRETIIMKRLKKKFTSKNYNRWRGFL